MSVNVITPENLKYDTSNIEQQKCVSGSPAQQLSNVFTNVKENFFCGVWRSTKGKWTLNYTEDEFCYLTRGKIVLTSDQGEITTINAGEAFTIAAGFQGTWETIEDCEKFYAIYEESA